MSNPIPVGGLEVTKSGLAVQFQAQLRLLIAAIAGALVTAAANRLHLPILTAIWGVQGDQIVGIIVGTLALGSMSAWAWMRNRLVNSRWWHLAIDPRVPPDLVRPAPLVLTPKEKLP